MCVCVCTKLTHFQSHGLFRGNCRKRGKRADFCGSVGLQQDKPGLVFHFVCVCVCVCVF